MSDPAEAKMNPSVSKMRTEDEGSGLERKKGEDDENSETVEDSDSAEDEEGSFVFLAFPNGESFWRRTRNLSLR